MENFPLAREQQKLRRQGRSLPGPTVRSEAREPQPVKISLMELKGRMAPSAFRDNFAQTLANRAKHGSQHERRRASIMIELLAKIEDGTISKRFLEAHPTIIVDVDGDIYDAVGNASKGAYIKDLQSTVPAEISFDRSDEEEEPPNVAPHEEGRGDECDSGGGRDARCSRRAQEQDRAHVIQGPEDSQTQPSQPEEEKEGQRCLSVGEEVKGAGELAQVPSVQLKPEVKAHPPQAQRQQGEELSHRLIGHQAQNVRPKGEADEEEVGSCPEEERGARGEPVGGEGDAGPEKGQENQNESGEQGIHCDMSDASDGVVILT